MSRALRANEGPKNYTVSTRLKQVLALLILLAGFALLYRNVIPKLVHDWANDGNYSHGFLIVPIALYFVWERRGRLARAIPAPSVWGMAIILAGMALLMTGVLGSELFLTRISILGSIAGLILFLYGRHHLKILAFPVLFLLLMIPIPAIIFNQISFPLQLLASRFGELMLSVLGIPVLREGNVIQLANTSLEVAEACSGIRSLISLLTLGIVYGYFADRRLWVRILLALGTVPIAILANGFRVAGTGVAAHYYGQKAAEGFFHAFSGWLIFLLAFLMLFVLQHLICRVAPLRPSISDNKGASSAATQEGKCREEQ
jgi:exosortase